MMASPVTALCYGLIGTTPTPIVCQRHPHRGAAVRMLDRLSEAGTAGMPRNELVPACSDSGPRKALSRLNARGLVTLDCRRDTVVLTQNGKWHAAALNLGLSLPSLAAMAVCYVAHHRFLEDPYLEGTPFYPAHYSLFDLVNPELTAHARRTVWRRLIRGGWLRHTGPMAFTIPPDRLADLDAYRADLVSLDHALRLPHHLQPVVGRR